LEHHVVRSYLVDQAAWRDLFEPVTGEDIAREIFRWQQVELRTLVTHVVALELVIHRFEHEGNPSDTALDRDELNRRIPIQHARHYQIAHLPAVLQEDIDREHGESWGQSV